MLPVHPSPPFGRHALGEGECRLLTPSFHAWSETRPELNHRLGTLGKVDREDVTQPVAAHWTLGDFGGCQSTMDVMSPARVAASVQLHCS